MDGHLQACSKCGRSFAIEEQSAHCRLICPGCRATTYAYLFPALYRPPETIQGQAVLDGAGEASCFYHASRKATAPCDGCGRFLCALCDVPLKGGHWCPTCVQEGRQQPGKMDRLENQRTLYDSIALSLAVLPILTIWGTLLAAPVVLFMVFRFWNRPTSLLPRTKIRFVMAGLIALLLLVGWGAGVTALVLASRDV